MQIATRITNKITRLPVDLRLRKIRRSSKRRGANLRPYQANIIMEIDRQVKFRGRKVLEIGGDLDGTTARGMMAAGAKSIVSINIDSKFDLNIKHKGIERRNMDARELDFPIESFDLVMGIAVLEHFHDFDVVLRRAFDSLVPGGYLYFQGGPLWHSAKGHHLVVEGRTGTKYHFANGPDPLDDWAHLLHDCKGMKQWLIESRDIDPGDAEVIADYVYNSPLINRAKWKDILRICHDSPFQVAGYDLIKDKSPTSEQLEKLHRALGSASDQTRQAALTVLLKKPNLEN